MFPDVLPPIGTGVTSGKVFSYRIENLGLARGRREVNADMNEWNSCRKFEDFDHCYQLSLGMLTLQSAIREA
jgi:hypothetical protein